MDIRKLSDQGFLGQYKPVGQVPSKKEGSPDVNVIAHIDATEEVVEPFLVARIDDFEKAKAEAGNSLEVTAEVYRAGVTPKKKIMKGLAILGSHLAIPAAGFAIGGIPGLIIGGLIDVGMFLTGLSRQGLGEIASGFEHKKTLPEPHWKGMRKYNISPDKTSGFDSAPTEINENVKKPTTSELGEFFASNMKKYPSATNVVFVSGHGFGYRQVASMPVKDLKSSLDIAKLESGKTPDVVVMESCLMGNLEAMAELKDSAKVAVVSEEVLSVGALPLKEMLADAAKIGGTPEEIGKRMVELAGKEGKIETLAAINLEKITPLVNSLDNLGRQLSLELNSGNRDKVQAAAKEAMKFPQGKMMFLERMLVGFSDLGGFLSALEKKNLSQETIEAVKQTKKFLDEAVIAKASDKDYKDFSGLSFQVNNAKLLDNASNMGSYNDVNVPQAWKDFIGELWLKEKK